MFKDKLVLIIDDSTTIRSYLKSILNPLGAQVAGAATGQEGLDMCKNAHYDLVLLDLILPDMDGIQVLERIREKNTTSAIVMITGHGGIRSAMAAAQQGADGYLQKQELTATAQDHSEFLYALQQALEHRAGVVAQQQLEKMRADFNAMITHDLRNPVGVILTAAEMLQAEHIGQLSLPQRDLVSIIYSAAAKMAHLINDSLDLARIDAGYLRLERERVDLRESAVESARLARLQAQAKRQTLTLDLPGEAVVACVDAERFKQLLDNLLSNAVKYTPAEGQITVQLTAQNDQVTLCVSDTGIGIPPEQLPHLFSRYYRITGMATRGVQGTGLGLLIVKEIVEAHGGDIRVESAGVAGQGTRFIVTIPREPPSPAAKAASQQELELRQEFVREARRHVGDLHNLLQRLSDTPHDRQLSESAQRITHTLKGDAGVMQLTEIYNMATDMDNLLRPAARGDLALSPHHLAELSQMLNQLDRAIAGLNK